MIHDRHFSVEEANAELPRLTSLLHELRKARDRLAAPDAHRVLAEAAPTNGGGEPATRVGRAFLEVRDKLAELAAIGVVIRDLDRGLVDFPALDHGREIYLCWELGEDRVAFWHDLESGYRGRQPLD